MDDGFIIHKGKRPQRPRSPRLIAIVASIVFVVWMVVPQPVPSSSGSYNHYAQKCDDTAIPLHDNGTYFDKNRFSKDQSFLEALSTCQTLECIHDAHLQPQRRGAKYNFPQFFVLGAARSATTGLRNYLNSHPEVFATSKEPDFFSEGCIYPSVVCNKLQCSRKRTLKYIKEDLGLNEFIKAGGQLAAYDASPQNLMMATKGLSTELYNLMPWLKMIVIMREPISRAMSAHAMQAKTQQAIKKTDYCLKKYSMAYCLLDDEKSAQYGHPMNSYYSQQLRAWLSVYPPEQFYMIQTEDLQQKEKEGRILIEVKKHIGLDFKKIQKSLNQSAASCLGCLDEYKDGWDMEKSDYLQLMDNVKNDVDQIVALIDEYKFGNGTRWRENWQAIWKKNLATCQSNGMCKIQLSSI